VFAFEVFVRPPYGLLTIRLYRFGEYLIAVAAERVNVDTANFNGPKSAAAGLVPEVN
jgi:hypothetical protein